MRGVAPAVIGALAVSLVQIAPPDGAEWLHDIKFDGYRMHARVEGGRARLLTRTDLDWTSKYLAIADAATALLLGSTIPMASLRRARRRHHIVQSDPECERYPQR